MSNMKIILFMYKSLHCLTTYCSMYYYVQKKDGFADFKDIQPQLI